jgi:lipid-A-disaccharide synthase
LVTSGTATFETALFGVPQVVCYRAGSVSYRLAKWLVNKDLKFISIVNLIAGKQVVKELIQADFNLENTVKHLGPLLDGPLRQQTRADYKTLRGKLDKKGGAALAAAEMVAILRKQTKPV